MEEARASIRERFAVSDSVTAAVRTAVDTTSLQEHLAGGRVVRGILCALLGGDREHAMATAGVPDVDLAFVDELVREFVEHSNRNAAQVRVSDSQLSYQ